MFKRSLVVLAILVTLIYTTGVVSASPRVPPPAACPVGECGPIVP